MQKGLGGGGNCCIFRTAFLFLPLSWCPLLIFQFLYLQVQSEKRKLESEVKLLGDRARQQGQENEQLRGEIAFLR